ncbi:ROK family protein [Tsukamurella sp. 8F]|uniref:ROK family protein n=1 Tax=unclassified Tsukamurella TaxID=2633480 RepID=UPI0023B9B297|nr:MULTISPECIES: ROK family protein [unclassified Tsukamurella]MDF0532016.1 ROK family protein [Tsukamurella sp. 8J]MDF0588421.1 ROK family protein [Tsukamurella sp. 8F]
MNQGPATIGIDIGGTSVRAGVVDAEGTMLDSARAETPRSASAVERCLDRLVGELAGRNDVAAVGLAVAGFLDPERKHVAFAPHLPWRDAAVPDEMSARIGLPVVMEHDANSAAWAEYAYGGAKGAEVTCVVAIGTGIGAALIVDGKLFRGAFGVAPELGHLQVVPDGRPCTCGKQGCWERYCSGTALVETAIDMMAPSGTHGLLMAREVAADPGSLTGRRVAAAAEAGDPVALDVMADFAKWLGVGLAMVSDIFDPDLIVLSGGVGSASRLYLDDARDHYARLLTGAKYRRKARIRATELGERAGMLGAAAIARETVASAGR